MIGQDPNYVPVWGQWVSGDSESADHHKKIVCRSCMFKYEILHIQPTRMVTEFSSLMSNYIQQKFRLGVSEGQISDWAGWAMDPLAVPWNRP